MAVVEKPQFFDTPGAADYLGLKPNTLEIWRSLKREGPPFIRIGRLVRYRREHLDEWLQRRTEQSTELAAV